MQVGCRLDHTEASTWESALHLGRVLMLASIEAGACLVVCCCRLQPRWLTLAWHCRWTLLTPTQHWRHGYVARRNTVLSGYCGFECCANGAWTRQ